jgi:N6-adenosine-specific RNA methylase IME4
LAATAAKLKAINADARQGTRRDAVLFSVGANASHGLRRTHEDKRQAVRTLLEDEEWSKWSDAEIARRTGTSHPFVGEQRKILTCNVTSENGERQYTTKHGTPAVMHTDNIGKSSVLLDMVPESDILQAAMDIRIKRAVENRERIQAIKEQPITVPKGKFQTIVIDPPWPMEKIDRDTRPNQVGFDYPTMSEEDLMDWPLSKFAADNCHLYLWTTHRFQPIAMRLAEHWGFTYQCLMTWVKNVGMTPYSWMYSTEHVLFCRRGFLSLEKLGMRLDFRANVREHSRKPDIFYEIVRQASPGPRLDMFSREPREGFEQHGNEAAKFQGVTA